MRFKDEHHRRFYLDCIKKADAQKDPYRQSLFYILGLTDDTRKHINSLYNFHNRCISFDGLLAPWQTSTAIKVTRLAFNLYNGFAGHTGGKDEDFAEYYTPYNLFDTPLASYFIEGIKLRYPACFRRSGTSGCALDNECG